MEGIKTRSLINGDTSSREEGETSVYGKRKRGTPIRADAGSLTEVEGGRRGRRRIQDPLLGMLHQLINRADANKCNGRV